MLHRNNLLLKVVACQIWPSVAPLLVEVVFILHPHMSLALSLHQTQYLFCVGSCHVMVEALVTGYC